MCFAWSQPMATSVVAAREQRAPTSVLPRHSGSQRVCGPSVTPSGWLDGSSSRAQLCAGIRSSGRPTVRRDGQRVTRSETKCAVSVTPRIAAGPLPRSRHSGEWFDGGSSRAQLRAAVRSSGRPMVWRDGECDPKRDSGSRQVRCQDRVILAGGSTAAAREPSFTPESGLRIGQRCGRTASG